MATISILILKIKSAQIVANIKHIMAINPIQNKQGFTYWGPLSTNILHSIISSPVRTLKCDQIHVQVGQKVVAIKSITGFIKNKRGHNISMNNKETRRNSVLHIP
jgi:hypothetical protein